WILGLLLLSGLVATVSLARAGVRHVWATGGRAAPRVELVEAGPVLALILSCVLLTVFAEPVFRYTAATAEALHSPRAYIDGVLSTRPTRAAVEEEGAP